jgi:LysR family transcriptional regulator, glycine cleavage system transcriptional activator
MKDALPIDRVPSLTALKVVLAIAERGSTTGAGELLHLSQSAVSKQLHAAELALGVRLFKRGARGMVPTAALLTYLPYAREALERLTLGAQRLADAAARRQPIRLHIPAIVGERWLLDRFSAFANRHPQLDIQFTNYVSANAAETPDLAISYGSADAAPGSRYLFGRQIVLVAAPGYLRRIGGLAKPAEIERATFLQHFQMTGVWAEFTERHGIRGAVPAATVRFGFASLVIRAATMGQGMALLPRCFVGAELHSGALVNPAGLDVASGSAYYLSRPRDGAPRGTESFFRWLASEALSFEKER